MTVFVLIISFLFSVGTVHAQNNSAAAAPPPTIDLSRAVEDMSKSKVQVEDWADARVLCTGDCPTSMWYANPKDIADETHEVHVISFYRGNEKVSATQPTKKTLVRITKAEKPVILMLSSYHGVDWKIESDPGVKIGKIFLCSYELGTVDASPGITVKVLSYADTNIFRPSIYSKDKILSALYDGLSFFDFLKSVQKIAGHKVTSYQGKLNASPLKIPAISQTEWVTEIYRLLTLRSESAVANAAIIEAKSMDPRLLGVLPAHRLTLAKKIPNDIRQIVWSAVDSKYYMVNTENIYTMDTNGRMVALQIPQGESPTFWHGGIAYNDQLKRIYIVSTWHTGHHHVYDPKIKQWYTFKIEGNSASALTYSTKTKKLYGVAYPIIAEYDDSFKVLKSWDVSTNPPMKAELRDGNSSANYLVYESGNHLVLLSGKTKAPGEVILFNPLTEKIVSTH